LLAVSFIDWLGVGVVTEFVGYNFARPADPYEPAALHDSRSISANVVSNRESPQADILPPPELVVPNSSDANDTPSLRPCSPSEADFVVAEIRSRRIECETDRKGGEARLDCIAVAARDAVGDLGPVVERRGRKRSRHSRESIKRLL
jgi:hypothetical protein